MRLASSIVLAIGTVLLPLAIGYGTSEGFRLPKQLLFYALAIAVTSLLAAAHVLRRVDIAALLAPHRRVLQLIAVAFVWALVTAALATNRTLSLHALGAFAAAAALFLAILTLIGERSVRVLGLLLAPVAVNAAVLLLQVAKIWNPFRFPADYDARLMQTGLIGNANDLGVYLVVPAIVAMVLTVVDRRLRPLWIVAAVVALVAIAATLTITAMIAVAAATLVLFFRLNRRLGVAVAVLIPVAVVVAVMAYAPLRARAVTFARAAKARDVEALTSQRLVAFTTTWEMFRDHPLFGVGPGCFPFEYMPYRSIVDERHPLVGGSLFRSQPNFGEAHNDHLQLLAETGVLGYALFLAALALLASVSLHGGQALSPVPTARAAQLLALPLATAIFVSCLTQFPLHLAAPLYEYLFAGAACLAWGRRDVA